jgi:hypothetical protein
MSATRAAENGATVSQLNAIFGWSGTAMPSLYTQAADRKRLAQEAMSKVLRENETTTSIRSPMQEVRAAMVRSRGLEPPHLAMLAPQASASTNSATTAWGKDVEA